MLRYDRHPIELDRDAYLRRTLALELMRLDQLQMAFEGKAIRDSDVAAGVLVKIAEQRATLLGLNPRPQCIDCRVRWEYH